MKDFFRGFSLTYILLIPFMSFWLGLSNYQMSCAVLVGALVAIFTRLDEIEKFSFGNMKVELKKQIEEARTTIRELKFVAGTLAEYSLVEIMAGCFGFQGGISRYDRFILKDNIFEQLKKIGFSDAELNEIEKKTQWKTGVSIIFWNAISHVLEKRKEPHQINSKEPHRKKVSDLIDSKMNLESGSYFKWIALSSNEIREIIISNNIEIDEPLEGWLSDYDHYLQTGEIRRVSQLLKKDY